jgi:hypothetical protein
MRQINIEKRTGEQKKTGQEIPGRTNRPLSSDSTQSLAKRKNWRGYMDAQTHRQQDDLINLLTKIRGGIHRRTGGQTERKVIS